MHKSTVLLDLFCGVLYLILTYFVWCMCRDRESKRTFGNTLRQTKVTLTSQQTLNHNHKLSSWRCFGGIHYTFPSHASHYTGLCVIDCVGSQPCVNVFSIQDEFGALEVDNEGEECEGAPPKKTPRIRNRKGNHAHTLPPLVLSVRCCVCCIVITIYVRKEDELVYKALMLDYPSVYDLKLEVMIAASAFIVHVCVCLCACMQAGGGWAWGILASLYTRIFMIIFCQS